jgi:hypothetical protein
MISSSASRPASLWARSITTLITPLGMRTVQTFIRPGLFWLGSKDRSPSDTCSAENPNASVAEVTARTFSTLTLLSAAKVIGTSTTSTTATGSEPAIRTLTVPPSKRGHSAAAGKNGATQRRIGISCEHPNLGFDSEPHPERTRVVRVGHTGNTGSAHQGGAVRPASRVRMWSA